MEQIIARTHLVMHYGTFRVERGFINDAVSLDFRSQKFPLIFPYLNTSLNSMSLYFALLTVENNKNKKTDKFQGDMLNFCNFIQVFCIYHKSPPK